MGKKKRTNNKQNTSSTAMYNINEKVLVREIIKAYGWGKIHAGVPHLVRHLLKNLCRDAVVLRSSNLDLIVRVAQKIDL